MKALLKSLQHPIYEIVERVSDNLGLTSYAVGGVIRDIILNRDSKDIDIVVIGSGIELAKR
jgi:tRNA nucleotidyltransferase/poly(A) polymerase